MDQAPQLVTAQRVHAWRLAGGQAVIPGAKSVAMIWGDLPATATRPGRTRPVNDTWVAACCLAYGLPLATMNVKDSADFAEDDD